MEKEIENKKSKFYKKNNDDEDEEEEDEQDIINDLPENNCTSGYVLKNNLAGKNNSNSTLKSYSPIDYSTIFPIKTYINDVSYNHF